MSDREGLYQRLLQLTTQLASSLSEQEIQTTAVSLLAGAFEAEACAMFRLGPGRAQGQIAAAYPHDPLAGTPISQEECLLLLPCLAREEGQLIQQSENTAWNQLLDRFGAGSGVVYPLQTEETLPPLLFLGYQAESFPMDPETMDLCRTIVRTVASALSNSRLYQQTHRRLRELRLLHEVAMAASTTLDFGQILRRVVEALWQSLNPDICGFLLVDEAAGVLRGDPSSHGFPEPLAELVIPIGQGLTGWAAQTGQPVLIPDVTQDPRYVSGGLEGIRSELCVPIQVSNEIVGVLDLQSRQPNAFSRDDLRLLTILAGQLSLAMGRSHIFQQVQQRVRELTSLMRVSMAMQRATSVEEVVEVVLAEAFLLVGREQGTVILLDRQANCFRIAASRGIPEDQVAELNRRGIPASFGTFAVVLQSQEMLVVPDTSIEPRVQSGFGPVPAQLTNVPLKTDQDVIGILVLDAVPPDDMSRRLLQSMANLAAVAIERAWLFEETRRRLEEVRLLQEVALAATSTLEFDEVLRRSVEALRRRLDFEVFGFMVVDERAGLLKLHPAFVGVPEELHGFTIPIGEGITGWVAETGEAYLSPDVKADSRYRDAVPDMRSEMCVPVTAGNQVIAVIDLESAQPNAFDQNDVRLLSAMANQLAVALQNARLYEMEQERLRLAESMRQVATLLGATLDVDALLDQALDNLDRLLPYEVAFLILLRGRQVERVRVRGTVAPPEDGWLAPKTLGGRVYAEHRTIVVPDAQKIPSWQPWPGMEQILSWIGVPFLSKAEITGMLLLGVSEANTYNRDEAAVAFSFGGQLALAIERARLYEQERRRAEQLDLLHRIGQRVGGLVDLEPLLEETVLCLNEVLQAHQCSVALLEDDELVVAAAAGQIEPRVGPLRVQLDGPGIVSWVARKGVPLLVPDVTADPRFKEALPLPDTRAEMAVPLQTKDRVMGVLDVQGSRVGQFDESDLSTLQAIGTQVAGAVERALLYADLRDTVRQLQETDRLRSDFLSTINHEMRAPLTAILGFTDFLLREQTGPLTSAQKEYLGDIRAGGERILNLVDNLLEAARLEEGRVLPRCVPVSIAEVVSRIMAMVQPASMDKAITLTSRVSADLPAVWADPMMVERILINLLSNAVKFTPPGGSVWVEAKGGGAEPGMMEIRVCDTGIGIAPEHFEEVFRRYRRLETPGVGQVGGTGLGLYIVHGLVEAHGGHIWVESTVGQGSTFIFTLPLASAQASAS